MWREKRRNLGLIYRNLIAGEIQRGFLFEFLIKISIQVRFFFGIAQGFESERKIQE